MSYVITSKCAGTCDSACVDVCPMSCIAGPISVEELRRIPAAERPARLAGVQLFIDPDDCIECGMCVAECPTDAIYLDRDVPAEHQTDISRNAAFFKRR